MDKQLVVTVLSVLVLLVALISLGRSCGSGEDRPSKAEWLCQDCGETYTFSQKELEQHFEEHYGEPLSCPLCGGEHVGPARFCPHCDAPYPHTYQGPNCPNCKEPLHPEPEEG